MRWSLFWFALMLGGVGFGLPACRGQRVGTQLPATAAAAGDLVDWEVLRTVTIPGHRLQRAQLLRFSYVTRSDRTEVATARLAIPVAPDGTLDVVAHLHGTIGFADHCAPSLMPGFGFESPLNPIPADMVAAGRVVVMPDYPGLGAPGPHRYVERDATGRSVWDAVVAARRLVAVVEPFAQVSKRTVLMGHSQGGHAMFAALATQKPADDVELMGALAFAPPGNPVRHAELVATGKARPAPFAWALVSYARAYPDELNLADWLHPRVGEALPERIETTCAPKIKLWLGDDPGQIFSNHAMSAFQNGQLPAEVLRGERIELPVGQVPILVYHGAEDDLLPPELSKDLSTRLAREGASVDWRLVEGAGHLGLPRKVRSDAVAWVDAVFADKQKAEPLP